MEIQRLPSHPISSLERKTPNPAPNPDPGPQDSFEPENPPQSSAGKAVFATTSLGATAGMFLGARFAPNPALGFVAGALVGGAVGFALARFAYAKDQ